MPTLANGGFANQQPSMPTLANAGFGLAKPQAADRTIAKTAPIDGGHISIQFAGFFPSSRNSSFLAYRVDRSRTLSSVTSASMLNSLMSFTFVSTVPSLSLRMTHVSALMSCCLAIVPLR